MARDIVTPRVEVFKLEENMVVGDLKEQVVTWSYTRVPLYNAKDAEQLKTYVRLRDVKNALLKGQSTLRLKDLARPLRSVPEVLELDRLLRMLLEKHEWMCAVIDEHGGLSGILTIEDIVEQLVDRDILDEYDERQ
jgi:CBS domain containing-hemolysin-like protein